MLHGLVGVWHVNVLGCATQCVLAYDDRLRRLPAHLQQVEMESNGKHVTLAGEPVGMDTCPMLFGEPGTNAQHSFMQLVHQGTRMIPVDFILAAVPDHDRPEAHRALAANAFAQSEALLRGRSEAQVRAEMARQGRIAGRDRRGGAASRVRRRAAVQHHPVPPAGRVQRRAG